MGCGQSKIDPDERDAFEKNAKIDRMLRQDKKVEARTVKILLLGMYSELKHHKYLACLASFSLVANDVSHQALVNLANRQSSSRCESSTQVASQMMNGDRLGQ